MFKIASKMLQKICFIRLILNKMKFRNKVGNLVEVTFIAQILKIVFVLHKTLL